MTPAGTSKLNRTISFTAMILAVIKQVTKREATTTNQNETFKPDAPCVYSCLDKQERRTLHYLIMSHRTNSTSAPGLFTSLFAKRCVACSAKRLVNNPASALIFVDIGCSSG